MLTFTLTTMVVASVAAIVVFLTRNTGGDDDWPSDSGGTDSTHIITAFFNG